MFHLAIPAENLSASTAYYENLGCTIGRKYADSVIIDFFGHQLVLHKAPVDITIPPEMYPRHFGIVFENLIDFLKVYQSPAKIWKDLMTRHRNQRGEHMTFFLCDPSNNLLEFKYYTKLTEII